MHCDDTHVHCNCIKDNNSLTFKWNNRNNPLNYAIQLMRSPSFLYIYVPNVLHLIICCHHHFT